MADFVQRFVFDIFTPLADQLAHLFKQAPRAELTETHVGSLPDAPGVYGLHLKETLVYVGKADDNLRERLGQHLRKLSRRQNLNLEEMTFCALEMSPDLAPAVSETILLKRPGFAAEWNNSGFGSKATGAERFDQKPSVFNKQYPIRHDWVCASVVAREYLVSELLKAVKVEMNGDGLFFPSASQGGLEALDATGMPTSLSEVRVRVPRRNMTAWDLLKLLESACPAWRAVKLHGWLLFWRRFEKDDQGVKETKFKRELA